MLIFILHRVLLLVWSVAIVSTVYGTLVGLIHLRRKSILPENSFARLKRRELSVPDFELAPISILKPLKGIDPGIEQNLESFFNLSYPDFELLFSVADEHDAVIPTVRKLIARHPAVKASLTVCSANSGPNPKINNLLSIYNDAKNDWVLISDSNTRVPSHHLRRLAEQFRNGIAMQTSVVAGVDADGLGGLLESAFLNTFYARSVLALNTLGHPCVIGKSMLFRKSILERTGGLRALEVHIAEDYAAGRKLHQLGFRVQVSRDPIRQYIGPYSFQNFWSRHIRWGRLRKMQTPAGFTIEPLFNSILSGALGAYAASSLFHVNPLAFLACHLAAWFTCDLLLYTRVADYPGMKFLPVWILREILHFPLWIHIASGNTILWRGKEIRLVKPPTPLLPTFTLHGLQEFLRNPQKHMNLDLLNPLDAITDAYSLFDEDWEQDLETVTKPARSALGQNGRIPAAQKRPPEQRV